MTERTLDIRKNLVSSSGPPRRRKSEAELRAMDHKSRLFYEIFSAPTMSDSEKQRALRARGRRPQQRRNLHRRLSR